jgi:hypothetical protein
MAQPPRSWASARVRDRFSWTGIVWRHPTWTWSAWWVRRWWSYLWRSCRVPLLYRSTILVFLNGCLHLPRNAKLLLAFHDILIADSTLLDSFAWETMSV